MESQKEKALHIDTSKSYLKTRVIPLSISLNSRLGILNFPSQISKTTLQKPQIQLKQNKQIISYKNAIHGSQSEDSQEDTIVRKKQLLTNIVTIKPQNFKKKYFKVQIPVHKAGNLRVREKKQKQHFVIEFSMNNGTLTVVNDIYDAKTQITRQNTNQNNLTFDQKMKIQNARLDNRRREEKIEVVTDKKKK